MKTHKFIFGVFTQGNLLFPLGSKVTCTHNQAEIIVTLLDLAKETLQPTHYFAYDYASNHKL